MEKNYIKFQVYLMAIYDKKKLEKSIFYLLPKNSDFARFNVTFVLKHSEKLKTCDWEEKCLKYMNRNMRSDSLNLHYSFQEFQ